jgi:hypothetical protein
MNVDGDVRSGQTFGCRDGLFPMIAGFLATEAQVGAVLAGSQSDVINAPTFVSVCMPSGRTLTFVLSLSQEALAEFPESRSEVVGLAGGREPVETASDNP